MSYTVLDVVQAVASSLDSDEVNSINDSVESQQIALLVKSVYLDVVERADLPENFGLFTLDASGENTKPVLMTVPENVERLAWIKYNKETTGDTDLNFQEIYLLPLFDFMQRQHSLAESDDNVGTFSHTVGTDTYTFLYQTDRPPTYFTSLDDNTIIFDSYDSDVDTTLQKSKTLCYGKLSPEWVMEDTYVPPLDNAQMQLWLNESKSLAWAELKQTQHVKAEQSAKRQWVSLQRSKNRVVAATPFDRLPNYGRK